MFIDTSQYRVSSFEHQDSTKDSNGLKDEENGEIEDLIDFSDPLPLEEGQKIPVTDLNARQQSDKKSNEDDQRRSGGSSYDTDILTSLFLDNTSPSTSSSNGSSNRQSNGSYGVIETGLFPWAVSKNGGANKNAGFSNWEKFE